MSLGSLNEDILQHVACWCEQSTLAALTRVSKATQRLVTRRLYAHITIHHESQYLDLLEQANFIPEGPSEDYPYEHRLLKDFELPPPESYASTRNPALDHLTTLTCLVRPPRTFTESLTTLHPHLERGSAMMGAENEHRRFLPTFRPLRLARFELATDEGDLLSFSAISRLVDPDEFVVRSTDPWAQCWRMQGTVAQQSWVSLRDMTFVNCLPLRPDMGDMPESFALPYMCHTLLRTVTVLVTEWDASENGILEQVAWQVPLKRGGKHGEWPVFETFLIKVVGDSRLEKAKKQVLKVIGWEGKELRRNVEARLRWELLPGVAPPQPAEWEGEDEADEDAREYDEWDDRDDFAENDSDKSDSEDVESEWETEDDIEGHLEI